MRFLTTSPMLTMPVSRPSSTTGRCRTRASVMIRARLSTLSSGVVVVTVEVMIEETGSVSKLLPMRFSARTTSRSDTMPRTLPEPSVDSFDLTVVLSALADPGRRALMTALYQRPDPIDCSVLAEEADLGLSNPTISHHYRVLREAGLTRTFVEGRHRIVRVRRDDMEERFPGLLQAVLGGR